MTTQPTGKIIHHGNVPQARQMEYPSLQRQLEVLWAALEELQIAGVHHFSADVQHMLVKIKAVQIRFPDDPDALQ